MEILKKFIEENKNQDIFKIVKNLWIKLEYIDYIESNGCCINIFWENYILINQNLDEKWTLFTIWHELCHFLLWEKGFSINTNFATKDFTEKRADRFSVDLLAPTEKIKELENENLDIFQLSNYFSVPEEKLAIKLREIYPGFTF